MTYFEKNKEMSFGPNLLTMKSTHILSDFVQMGDQKYLPLIFPSLVTCLLTKTRGVQDFLEEDKEKKWINIPVPPTFYDNFRVSKVGNFTTGVGKVTNFIFTQLQETVPCINHTTHASSSILSTKGIVGDVEDDHSRQRPKERVERRCFRQREAAQSLLQGIQLHPAESPPPSLGQRTTLRRHQSQ